MIVHMRRTLACWIVLGSTSCFDEAASPVGDGPADSSDTTSASSPTSTATVTTTPEPSSTSDSTNSSDSADSSETSSTTDGTTGAPPVCGDDSVDDEELCDDGNDIDADGCNTNCRPSGEYLWGEVSGDIDDDVGNGIVVAPNGDVFATGRLFVDGVHDDVWLGSWTAAGDLRFSNSIDFGGSSEMGHDVVLADNDSLVLAVTGELGNGLLRAAQNGDLGARLPAELLGEEDVTFTPRAVGRGSSSFYFVGSDATVPATPAMVRVSNFYARVWAVDAPQGPGNNAEYTGVAVADGEAAVACGISGLEGFIHRRAAIDGALEWSVGDLPRLRGIAIAGNGDIVVVGTSFVAVTQDDLWVGRLSPDGSVVIWELDIDGGGSADDRGIGVAIDASDNITAAGNAAGGDALVTKLTPGGTPLWMTIGGSMELQASLDLTDVAVSPEGDVSIVGGAFGAGGDGDIFVAHFAR